MRTQGYENILLELEKDAGCIARAMLDTLEKNPNGMSRKEMVEWLFGRPASRNINNDSGDRKIRLTIAALRQHGVPIVSNSGEAGYRLDNSQPARLDMLAELISRRDRLNEQIAAASQNWQIPIRHQTENDTQPRMR